MTDSVVVRNTPSLGALRSELTCDPIDGFRARHDCPDGGQWIGAARVTEFEAMADAANHERACRHRCQSGEVAPITRNGGYSAIPKREPACE